MKLTLEDILAEWEKDSVIDKSELDNVSIRQSQLHSKYLQVWAKIKRKIYKVNIDLKETKQLLKRYLSGKMTKEEMDELGFEYDPWKGESKPLKSQLEEHIETHELYVEKAARFAEYQLMFETVSEIIDKIKWRHQDIRNAIDYMKFTSGF